MDKRRREPAHSGISNRQARGQTLLSDGGRDANDPVHANEHTDKQPGQLASAECVGVDPHAFRLIDGNEPKLFAGYFDNLALE